MIWEAITCYESEIWCTARNDDKQWIQWDLGTPTYITGIQTQGRSNYDQWVKKFTVQCSPDGVKWEDVASGAMFGGFFRYFYINLIEMK